MAKLTTFEKVSKDFDAMAMFTIYPKKTIDEARDRKQVVAVIPIENRPFKWLVAVKLGGGHWKGNEAGL